MLRRRTWKWAVLIFNIANNSQLITNELGHHFVPVNGSFVTFNSVSLVRSL